jgi:NitT/TauT family transport system substrate-binding protein
MMNKVIFKGIIALFLVALVAVGNLTGCARDDSAEPSEAPAKLTLAAYAGDTGGIVYIAQEEGYFTANALEVEIKDYEAGKLAADALLAGEADICTSADFVMVSDSFEHDDLRILATVALAETNELVTRKDSGINQPSDLKGKKVGVTRKSVGEFFLGTFLMFNGLTVEDIEIRDLKPSEIVEAISTGEIDAGFTWEPNIYDIKNRLEEDAISWRGQSGQSFYFILLAKEKFIEENPETVERFLRALIQAQKFMEQNEAEAKDFLARRFGYEPSYVDYIWQRHEFVVTLPQSLVLVMEDQARWRIESKLTGGSGNPKLSGLLLL